MNDVILKLKKEEKKALKIFKQRLIKPEIPLPILSVEDFTNNHSSIIYIGDDN